MGCDIHLYCEQKYKDKWLSADFYCQNKYSLDYKDEPSMSVVHLYNGRNYTLFSILANVRNSDGNEYISQPRGLPLNISEKVKEEYSIWDLDGHSCSWYTAKELFDWEKEHKVTKYAGMISSEAAKNLDDNHIFPTTWCGWTNMEGYVYREWAEEETPLTDLNQKIKERMSYLFNIYNFYDDNKKEELYQKYAGDFRIVFWFDS